MKPPCCDRLREACEWAKDNYGIDKYRHENSPKHLEFLSALAAPCTCLRELAEAKQTLGAFHAAQTACADGLCPICLQRELAEAKAERDKLTEDYHELLYAVENKYEGESRHQTALRYIRERAGMFRDALAAKEGE